MTIELYANHEPVPLSYEGVPLEIHVIQSLQSRACEWKNHYDCNIVHAVNTLKHMGCEVARLRVVDPSICVCGHDRSLHKGEWQCLGLMLLPATTEGKLALCSHLRGCLCKEFTESMCSST